MWITKVSINNPVFATMVMVALLVLGLFAYQRLGVEQIPDISPPIVVVTVSYPGASPEAVEQDITKPIEETVNTISGIKQIRSNSFESFSRTVVEFELSTNLTQAVQDVRDRVARIRAGLPRDALEPTIMRVETQNAQSVVSYALMAKDMSLRDLTTLADQVVVKQFQRAPGVGQVNIWGATSREITLQLRSRDLTAWGISVDQVMQAVKAANQDVPVGLVQGPSSEAIVRVEGRIRDAKQFADIPIVQRSLPGTDGNAARPVTVRLSQVADVIDGEAERESISRFNNQPSVSVQVYKSQDANVVETGDAVKRAAKDMQVLLPAGVELKEVWASSDWVKGSLDDVKRTIIEGAALTVLIVFLFLKSWRSTVITGLTLPIAVIATFIAIYAFGFTLNFMTMMALSLCIGLLIDDAIVVRENIVRYLGKGYSHIDAARRGTEEIGLAVMATTFTICAVFVPVAFMKGVIGRFFYPFGVTVAVAVLVSLFVSFTLDPMLSSIWHEKPRHAPRNRLERAAFNAFDRAFAFIDRVLEAVHRIYGRVLDWALVWRKTTLAIATTTFIAGILVAATLGSEFVPETDDGWISVNLRTAVGSSLERTDAKVRQIEDILRTFPEVEVIDSSIGSGDGRNTAETNIRLVPRDKRERDKKTIEGEMRKKLATVAGAELAFGWGQPISVSLLGSDPERLDSIVRELRDRMAQIPGIADVQSSIVEGTPAVAVKLRPIAADMGVTNESVGRALRPLVAGDEVGNWLGPDGQNYKIMMRVPRSERADPAALDSLLVPTSRMQADGTPMMVPVRQVAEVSFKSSPQVIKRQDLQRKVTISAGTQDRPVGDVSGDVKKLTDTFKLPPGYRFDIGGQSKDMAETGQAALGAMALAVIFIYIVLASQFGSFIQPIAIMASLPLSFFGAFVALKITGTTFNLFAIIGLIMLMGLVTKNAILVVDFANHGRKEGKSIVQALRDAGQVRLRPILMTTCAMIFGMLPLSLALGDGAELQAGMGRAIMGGVMTSTLLTLVVVPVLYAIFETALENRRERKAQRALRKAAHDAALGGDGNAASPVTPGAATPAGAALDKE
jgi:hydrophobe/amphiphile efflux-1 (HAE1) family protein